MFRKHEAPELSRRNKVEGNHLKFGKIREPAEESRQISVSSSSQFLLKDIARDTRGIFRQEDECLSIIPKDSRVRHPLPYGIVLRPIRDDGNRGGDQCQRN